MATLRCKPGDLAMVVRADTRTTKLALGMVLRVVSIDECVSALCCKPMWRLDREYAAGDWIFNCAADFILQPLRDQDAAAVDEMVEKLGAAPRSLTEVREPSHG